MGDSALRDDTAQMVAFLRARLDEDETEIRKHPDGEDDHLAVLGLAAEVATGYPCESYLRISKQRALREVEAKRRIVEQSEVVHERAKVGPSEGDGAWFLVLRYLALPYVDHPDYDPRWRP